MEGWDRDQREEERSEREIKIKQQRRVAVRAAWRGGESRRGWDSGVARRRRAGYVGCRCGGLLGSRLAAAFGCSGSSLGGPAKNLAGGGVPFVAGRRRRGWTPST
jgi:hypothetical protein